MELRLRLRLLAGTLTLLLLILAASPTASASSSSSSFPVHQIRILSAEKRVDLTSSIVRVFLTLKLENASPDAPASSFLLVFSPAEAARLSLLKAAVPSGKRKKKTYSPLIITPEDVADAPDGTQSFTVTLNTPVPAGGTALIEVLYVLTHALEPFPAEIGQSEPQLVYYRDSATLLSPYHVVEQVMYVKVGNGRVESFTRVEPTGRSGGELKYGGYSGTEAYKVTPVMVHFENNSPFAVVEELVREVEVSHWGSVQVTEHYRLKHGGARHTGVFSRLEYQSRPAVSGASSFKHLLARLPPHVHSVYYRDEIGNISSSHLRNDALKSELEIEPRYPLFGGWKATFIIGYGLPLQDFLFESPDGKRYLNFSFGCPLLETVVDELTIKVVLPEGSKNPSAEVSFPVEQHLETSYSYLDIAGRTTVVLKKKNVVPEHNIPFQIYYDFNPIFMLSEPLMLISVFFLFFIGCVAYLHIDLSIAKS